MAWKGISAFLLAGLLCASLEARASGQAAPSVRALSEGKRALAVVFVATTCPIVNRHAPELAALAKQSKAAGGELVLVYSNPADQAGAARHAQKYALTEARVVCDSDQGLKRALGAKVTPHAFVLSPLGKVLYSGRISDDGAGQAKPRALAPSHHELRDALRAVLAGKAVTVARTEAVGCVIEPQLTNAKPVGPTYAEHIAPILNANCVSCHREGEIGPMKLDSYAAAKALATNIAKVAEEKLMPPWKPAEGHGDFNNVRKLSAAQIQLLSLWAKSGAAAGDLSKAPPPPTFTKGWALGQPDLILKMPQSYSVAASGADIYQCFVLPTGLTEDKEVVAVEYRAGNRAVVHHVIGYIDTQRRARKLDEADPASGYSSFGLPGFLPDGELDGWAPGKKPYFLPDGIARMLPKGSDLVMQVHYHANGKPETDLTQVGIYFAKKPITKHLKVLPLIAAVDIPAGEPNYRTSAKVPMPFDAKLVFIVPHMHLLGKEIAVEAQLPTGAQSPLIKIEDWDFNWQDSYNYKELLALPKGTSLTLRARFDNSSGNPRNPSNPPRRVTWGEATTDEMCIVFLGYIADNVADPNQGKQR